MSHKSKPNPTPSADALSRKPVVDHLGIKSVHTHKPKGRHGQAWPLPKYVPGNGPGAGGSPTTQAYGIDPGANPRS